MIFALGFLLCGLLALLILPAFWRRALRLSTHRLEMLMPLSMDEVLAQRDQLRAQAAVAQRRIEQKLEAMTRDRADQMSEIGRRAAIIARLEADLGSLAATLDARDAELRDAWAQLGGLHSGALDLETRLREAQVDAAAQARLAQELGSMRMEFDTLRIEKASLETLVASLRVQDHDLRQRLQSLQLELELERRSALAPPPADAAARQDGRLQDPEAGDWQERRSRMQAQAALAAADHMISAAQDGRAPTLALADAMGEGAHALRPAPSHHSAVG